MLIVEGVQMSQQTPLLASSAVITLLLLCLKIIEYTKIDRLN